MDLLVLVLRVVQLITILRTRLPNHATSVQLDASIAPIAHIASTVLQHTYGIATAVQNLVLMEQWP